jgi:hypothetical protein
VDFGKFIFHPDFQIDLTFFAETSDRLAGSGIDGDQESVKRSEQEFGRALAVARPVRDAPRRTARMFVRKLP